MKGTLESETSRALSPEEVAETVHALASKVYEQLDDRPTAFVGLFTRGVTLANRVASRLSEMGRQVDVGTLDISLYRDDLDLSRVLPRLESSEIPFPLDDSRVIIFDDVIYTGRTVRAALEVLSDYGRPAKIELAVLVDRGWREIPIQPDYTGYLFETEQNERVSVRLIEDDGEDGVFLERST